MLAVDWLIRLCEVVGCCKQFRYSQQRVFDGFWADSSWLHEYFLTWKWACLSPMCVFRGLKTIGVVQNPSRDLAYYQQDLLASDDSRSNRDIQRYNSLPKAKTQAWQHHDEPHFCKWQSTSFAQPSRTTEHLCVSPLRIRPSRLTECHCLLSILKVLCLRVERHFHTSN